MESSASRQLTAGVLIEYLPEKDSLSPYEFWRQHRSNPVQLPEVRLMMAVLEDALKCYFDYARPKSSRESKLFREVEQWLFFESDEDLFSFENICAVLKIDPGYVRRGLRLFKEGSIRRWGRRKKSESTAWRVLIPCEPERRHRKVILPPRRRAANGS
jgi:hypothetical protein